APRAAFPRGLGPDGRGGRGPDADLRPHPGRPPGAPFDEERDREPRGALRPGPPGTLGRRSRDAERDQRLLAATRTPGEQAMMKTLMALMAISTAALAQDRPKEPPPPPAPQEGRDLFGSPRVPNP